MISSRDETAPSPSKCCTDKGLYGAFLPDDRGDAHTTARMTASGSGICSVYLLESLASLRSIYQVRLLLLLLSECDDAGSVCLTFQQINQAFASRGLPAMNSPMLSATVHALCHAGLLLIDRRGGDVRGNRYLLDPRLFGMRLSWYAGETVGRSLGRSTTGCTRGHAIDTDLGFRKRGLNPDDFRRKAPTREQRASVRSPAAADQTGGQMADHVDPPHDDAEHLDPAPDEAAA